MNNSPNLPPPRKRSPLIKKKQANLEDYLDDEEVTSIPANKNKGTQSKNSYSNLHSTKKSNPPPLYQKKGSLTGMLQQQEDNDEDDQGNRFENNSSFRPIANPAKITR